jgi:hypothetical protein
MSAKPLRQTMPTVAAWIDELRDAFGADTINRAIRNGVAGGSHFSASENGHSIGEPLPIGYEVSLADMVIAKPAKEGA